MDEHPDLLAPVNQKVQDTGKGKRGGGDAPLPDVFMLDNVIEIVNSARRPRLGLMTNRQDRAIHIRAWSYHAGLKTLGRVSDYDFESGPIPADLADRMPRVAMIPGAYAYFGRAATEGLSGHAAKWDLDRGSTRSLELRPRLCSVITNPVTISWGRACTS